MRKFAAIFIITAAILTAAFADTAKAYGSPEVRRWEELASAFESGGSATLIEDVEGSTPLEVAEGDAELDLNNHTMTYTGTETLFELKGPFTITDKNPNGCGRILTDGVKLAEMGEDDGGDKIQLLGIQRGAFNIDPGEYLMLGIEQEADDVIEEKDGLWYVRERLTQYEANAEPSILILKEGGDQSDVSVMMADYQGNLLAKEQYKITSADIAPYGEEGGESGSTQDEDKRQGTSDTSDVFNYEINNNDKTITVTPASSGVAVLNATLKLTDENDPSYYTDYEVTVDVAVESSEGYTLSFSDETVWTVPNRPATVTATLKNADGEEVDPSQYSLCLESDAQDDDDTKIVINGSQITVTQSDDWEEDVAIYAMESSSSESDVQAFSAALPQNSGEPRKLYKVATLHIRPESKRPSTPASGGSGGGCSAFGGTTALFAAGTLFAALRVKRKTR